MGLSCRIAQYQKREGEWMDGWKGEVIAVRKWSRERREERSEKGREVKDDSYGRE